MSIIPSKTRPLFMSALGLAALLYLSYWAGFPQELFTAFLLGLLILAVALAGYGWLAYYLLVRQLPAGHKNPAVNMLPVTYRRLLAIFLGIGGMAVTVGGFWDEVWHRAYGFPFGPDLLWRPHLLIYMGLLTPPLLGFLSLIRVTRGSKGTMQQKFRADPALGFLVMVGLLTAFSVPLDPVWHTIYGTDISAWSLPHLLLLTCTSLVMIMAAFMLLTTVEPKKWRGVWRANPEDWLLILFFSFAIIPQLQVLVTDWESANAMAQLRPIWLLPVLFVVLATFTGSIANRATRTFGAATVIAVLALAVRWGLTEAFHYQVSPAAWLPILGPALGLDIGYAMRGMRGQNPDSPLINSLAATIGMILISFPLINQLFPYLSLTGMNLVVAGLACLAAGIAGAWIGQAIGDGLSNAPRQVEAATPVHDRLRVAAPGLFTAAIVFIIFFVLTATPPT